VSSSLVKIQEKNFNELLRSRKKGVILFEASWCAACKIIGEILEEISEALKDSEIVFVSVDVAKNPGLCSRMGVMSLPNLFFLKNGRVLDQIIGTTSKKEILEKMEKLKK